MNQANKNNDSQKTNQKCQMPQQIKKEITKNGNQKNKTLIKNPKIWLFGKETNLKI